MPAPNEILDLIARFEQHLEAYRAGQYNETQLRRDYLDPFFKALGWGIEDYGRLQALLNGPRIYPRLCQIFEAADVRYNSGLFHFKKEPGRHEAPDELTLELDVDDKLLRDIFKNLYYPDSHYLFSILSADILGQVSEQFLGKIIRLTEGHRAVVEDKPEVKKAGGVYCTPTYIVDYIVRQTVGKLLDECSSRPSSPSPLGGERAGVRGENVPEAASSLAVTPAPPHPSPLPLRGGEGEARRAPDISPAHSPAFPPAASPRDAARVLEHVSKLRILDPACGSGSFLIGAYQHLLDWHFQLYIANDPGRWARGKTPPSCRPPKAGASPSPRGNASF